MAAKFDTKQDAFTYDELDALQAEIDATRDLMGVDFWPYGFAANEAVLQAA